MHRPALHAKLLKLLRELTSSLRSLKWTKLVPNVRPVGQILLKATDEAHLFVTRLVLEEEEGASTEQLREFRSRGDTSNFGLLEIFRYLPDTFDHLLKEIRTDDFQESSNDH